MPRCSFPDDHFLLVKLVDSVREIIYGHLELVSFRFEFTLYFAVVHQGARDIDVHGKRGQVDENSRHGSYFLFFIRIERKSFELYCSNNAINYIYQVRPTKYNQVAVRKHLLEPGALPDNSYPGDIVNDVKTQPEDCPPRVDSVDHL